MIALAFIFLIQFSLFAEFNNDYVREIECKFAKRMKRELDLAWAEASGKMKDKIEEMGMKFTSKHRATLEEARALQLYIMDEFVQAINANEEIQ